jgi:steroid 5-alpha reductase family enzyme
MSQGDIIVDFFYEMWAYQAYRAAIAAFVFYLIYLLIKNPCLVDVGWSVVHLVIGASLYFSYCLGNYPKPIIR